jgi:hypothetical protein
MHVLRRTRILTKPRALALACAAALTLGGCERSDEAPGGQSRAEMTWARAALERNPNLEIVAVDAEAGVFTVRERGSGVVHAVKANELAAAPVAQISGRWSPHPAAVETPPGAVIEEDAALSAANDADEQWTREPTESGAEPLKYSIERRGGQVRVSGPGVSIVSAGSPTVTTARGEAGQVTVEPIVCEGRQMMHLDNRRIFVEGDAITARNGCELYITNSRVVASGTGVVVRDATVHITNSYIEGAAGSYDAGIGAKMFLSGSTFNGVMHRDAFAQIQEQGAAQWP